MNEGDVRFILLFFRGACPFCRPNFGSKEWTSSICLSDLQEYNFTNNKPNPGDLCKIDCLIHSLTTYVFDNEKFVLVTGDKQKEFEILDDKLTFSHIHWASYSYKIFIHFNMDLYLEQILDNMTVELVFNSVGFSLFWCAKTSFVHTSGVRFKCFFYYLTTKRFDTRVPEDKRSEIIQSVIRNGDLFQPTKEFFIDNMSFEACDPITHDFLLNPFKITCIVTQT